MGDPQLWGIIWLVVAAAFVAGEMQVPGTFFVLPFAAGSTVSALLSFVGIPIWMTFPAFVVGSVLAFLALRPLAQRFDANTPEVVGVGANRLIGDAGVVVEEISPGNGQTGIVKVGGEEWVGQVSSGSLARQGVSVRILEVRGNRLIVEPEVTPLDAWRA